MKKLSDHYPPPQPKPIGVGTFLRKANKLYQVVRNKNAESGLWKIGLLDVFSGVVLVTAHAREQASLKDFEVSAITEDFEGWEVMDHLDVARFFDVPF